MQNGVVLTLHEFGLHKTLNEYSAKGVYRKKHKKERFHYNQAFAPKLMAVMPKIKEMNEKIVNKISIEKTAGELKLRLKDHNTIILRD